MGIFRDSKNAPTGTIGGLQVGQIPLAPGLGFALASVHPFSLLTDGKIQSVAELQRRAV